MVDLLNRNGFITHVMKTLYTIVVILATVALIGSIGASLQQQASAIVIDNSKEFKTLTKQFEKAVLDAAIDDPNIIPSLVDRYHDDVIELFRR